MGKLRSNRQAELLGEYNFFIRKAKLQGARSEIRLEHLENFPIIFVWQNK